MRALSIRQPWAWLIAAGHKTIENRSWHTNYRGPLLIHAARKMDVRFRARDWIVVQKPGLQIDINYKALQFGGIIARVDLVDIVTASRSPWFCGAYGWVLANPQPLPFRPLPGMVGLFDVSAGLSTYE